VHLPVNFVVAGSLVWFEVFTKPDATFSWHTGPDIYRASRFTRLKMSSSGNRYAIIGVGCIGGAVGITLAASRYDVAFVGRKSASFATLEQKRTLLLHLPEANADPLQITEANITSEAEAGLRDRNAILIGTKRTANRSVAEVVAKSAAPGALVVMLQNGLSAAEEFLGFLNEAGRNDLTVLDSAFTLSNAITCER
jgi:ketopantoate reductase